MSFVIRRRSSLDPPSPVIFESLTTGLSCWWLSVEGQQEPVVVGSHAPEEVTWSSPFCWRPNDQILFHISAAGEGSVVTLEHRCASEVHAREASILRHRWGEHLDRDLRAWWDTPGGRVQPYAVSIYRADVDDWSIVDWLEDSNWVVWEKVWTQVRVEQQPGWIQGEAQLAPGTSVWVFGFSKHRAAARCLVMDAADGDEWDAALREIGVSGAVEVVIPVAEFGRRLTPRME